MPCGLGDGMQQIGLYTFTSRSVLRIPPIHKQSVILTLVMKQTIIIDGLKIQNLLIAHVGEPCPYQQNPYSFNWWLYDPYLAPPKGVWFDVWISVYWDCVDNGSESIQCLSEDLHYRGQNNNNVYPPGSSSQ
ncbi:hypothetical protein F8M41_002242 [Gigaspora margarita]|uniref:Uncharacterized protein n=1 Tax=Gigaspora margarita TaxID=4874 RepID=A0A8H4AYT4_GIGMA|nr:hypothetical protein F8M41_002242 [Gigaspora margarita]